MIEEQAISSPSPDVSSLEPSAEGALIFVGAGPGSPDLLTLAGAKALRSADLVVLDQLNDSSIIDSLDLGDPPQIITSGQISELELIQTATSGQKVVRLIHGDLFLDGDTKLLARGLQVSGLRVDVIPGVSCFTAAASYVGVQGDSWELVDATNEVPAYWPKSETVIVKTAADLLDVVAESCNRPADEPVLVVSNMGRTSQLTEQTTWAKLAKVSAENEVFILAGTSVSERAQLDWFESKPLFDWRILVPVSKDQGGVLSERLASFGALPEEVPTMSIEPPRTEQQMEKTIRGLIDGRYEWIVFTSPNAVSAIQARFMDNGMDSRAMSGIQVAAVGAGTVRALIAWGITPDLTPLGDQTTANLAANFPAFDEVLDPINRVLVPRAEISTDALLAGIEMLGWEVEDVTAYRTVRAAPPSAEIRTAIKTGLFDAVVFASSSTVRNLIGIAGKPHHKMVVAAIGAATVRACEEHGLTVDAVATEPTITALADALADFAAIRRADQLSRGEPVTKPSQRRRRRRKAKLNDFDGDINVDQADEI